MTAVQVIALLLVALAAPAVVLTRDPLRQVPVNGAFGLLLALLFFGGETVGEFVDTNTNGIHSSFTPARWQTRRACEGGKLDLSIGHVRSSKRQSGSPCPPAHEHRHAA